MKAVPCTLRNDGDCSGAQRERFGRPTVAYHFQCRRAVEDENELVAGEMAFPMILAGGLDRQKQAIAVGSLSRDASFPIRRRRLGRPPEHRQLRNFRVETDDAGHSVFHDLLHVIVSLFPTCM